MKELKYWATSIFIDAVSFGLFYLWQVKDLAGAGNAFSFFVWCFIIMRTISAFRVDKGIVANNPRPPMFAPYHFVTEVAMVIALAWIGYTWTAIFFVVTTMLFEGARMTDPKTKPSKGD